MEEVCKRYSSLELSDGEAEVFSIDDGVFENSAISGEGILLGKLLCDKPVNKNVLKAVMGGLWNTKGNVSVDDMEGGIMSFTFSYDSDKVKVLDNGPWLFDRSLLILYDPVGRELEDPVFLFSEIWVQLHSIPLLARTVKMGEIIGGQIGQVRRVDRDREGRCRDPFVRVRILIDFSKPLRRGMFVNLGAAAENIWIDFKYERLADFCFSCGRVGHGWKQSADGGSEASGPDPGMSRVPKQHKFGQTDLSRGPSLFGDRKLGSAMGSASH